jgi:hypothetical protein
MLAFKVILDGHGEASPPQKKKEKTKEERKKERKKTDL